MVEKNKILMIAPACFPVTGAEAIVNSKLALGFMEYGYEIDIVTSDSKLSPYPSYGGECWKDLSKVTTTVPMPAGWNFLHLVRFASAAWKTQSLIRGIAWADEAYSSAKNLLKKKKYNFILARTTPGDLVASGLSKRYDIPWVKNWNDPYPHIKYPSPYGKGKSAEISLTMRRYLRQISMTANWTTFPCERLREYMCSYLPKCVLEKSSIVPHIGLEKFKFNKHKRNNKFIVCHAGKLNPPRDAGVFLKAIRKFIDNSKYPPSILVRLIGDQSVGTLSLIEELALGAYVHVLPSLSYLDSLEEMGSADICLLVEAACDEGVFLPSKYVDILQVSRPVWSISPVVGTMNDLIQEFGGGVVSDCTSIDSNVAALDLLYRLWSENVLEQSFSQDKGWSEMGQSNVVEMYNQIFDKISTHNNTNAEGYHE